MKKIILITGWLWYIWSHWVVAFEKAWYKTVIVDNLCNSNISTLDWIEQILWYKPDFFEIDLRKPHPNPLLRGEGTRSIINWKKELWNYWLEDIFKKYDFDGVIHFAGLKSPFESQKEPILYFDNNINWSIVLFDLMKKFNIKNIIFSSSANIYSSNNISPINEQGELWPNNPYWTTKYILEQLLLELAKFSWFKVISLRYFNPIWAHKSWEIWENTNGIPNNLLPFIMKVAKWELAKLKVFWNDYDTIDWTGVRDYIDVIDLINGHLKAYKFLENIKINGFFDVFNLWVWKWVSVLEIIKKSEKVIWKKINYEIADRRDWDLAEVYCNSSKAENELWFKVQISLEESLENSWNFYNK